MASPLLQLHRMLQNFQQADKTLAASLANNIPNQPQKLVSQLNPYSAHTEKRSSLAEVTAQLGVATQPAVIPYE